MESMEPGLEWLLAAMEPEPGLEWLPEAGLDEPLANRRMSRQKRSSSSWPSPSPLGNLLPTSLKVCGR